MCRSAMAGCSRKRPSTGCTRPSPSRGSTGEACSSPAEKCWADRVRSTACFTCAASTRITTAGASGPQPVSELSHADPLSAAFIEAAAQTGIPKNGDFNGATQEGTGFFQTTTRYGRRASTAVSYLRPALGRTNLHVETSALAQRIDFEGRRAVAVEYRGEGGALRTARARKEIL